MGNRCQQKYLYPQHYAQTKLDIKPPKAIAFSRQFELTEDFSSTHSFNASSIQFMRNRSQPEKQFDTQERPLSKSLIFKDSQILRKSHYVIFKILDSAVLERGELFVQPSEVLSEGRRLKIGYKQDCHLRLPCFRKTKKRLYQQQAQLELHQNRLVLTSTNRHSVFKRVPLKAPFPLHSQHYLLIATTLLTLNLDTLILKLDFCGGKFQEYVLSSDSFTIGSKPWADLSLTQDPLARGVELKFQKRQGKWRGELKEGGLCWQGVQRLEGEQALTWLMGYTQIQLRMLFSYA